MKRKIKLGVAVVITLGIVFCGVSGVRVTVRPNTAHADTPTSDKYDGDCTGQETAGRCADKCPADTSEGAYFLRGYDKETGAAVCGFSYFNACPYTEAVSADDPLCYKNQPIQSDPQPVTTSAPTEAAAPSVSCKGTK